MTYLIILVLVLLLIARVLVFRPPKPYQDANRRETVADGSREEEEELDLTFGGPSSDLDGATAEPVEELDLILDEESDDVRPEEVSTEEQPGIASSSTDTSDESMPLFEEKGSDEFDEDIPFIDDGEGANGSKREMDVAPALADVPDDYAQVEEDETPEELEERLEYFLGTDDEEAEQAVEESVAEHVEDTAEIADESEAVDETEDVEQEIEIEPEASLDDRYGADLREQEERLRSELNAAIENRETGKLDLLENALESLCIKQADMQSSFKQQQELLDELDGVMNEVQQALPGFQLKATQSSLLEGEHEIVRNLLIEASNQLDSSPQIASKILYQWGRIEEERGELATALEMYAKARSGDEENPDYLYRAGRLARLTGDTDNAISWLEKRVNIGQEKSEESVELAMTEHELAKVLVMEDENDRVEQLLLSAREKIEKLLGSDHPDLGPVLHDLGALYDSAAKYEQAEPLYKKALEITEQSLGKDHPRLGATLNKLAGLYEEIEMEQESESLYTRALEIKQKVLGENHPDVGTILNHLANLLKLQGKHDQAEPMFKKSLEITEVALGKDHPNLAVVLNDMAELYSEMGNEEQAEHFQERAFSLFGLPGAGSGFVEMDKDIDYEVDDDKDQTVAGS